MDFLDQLVDRTLGEDYEGRRTFRPFGYFTKPRLVPATIEPILIRRLRIAWILSILLGLSTLLAYNVTHSNTVFVSGLALMILAYGIWHWFGIRPIIKDLQESRDEA